MERGRGDAYTFKAKNKNKTDKLRADRSRVGVRYVAKKIWHTISTLEMVLSGANLELYLAAGGSHIEEFTDSVRYTCE